MGIDHVLICYKIHTFKFYLGSLYCSGCQKLRYWQLNSQIFCDLIVTSVIAFLLMLFPSFIQEFFFLYFQF